MNAKKNDEDTTAILKSEVIVVLGARVLDGGFPSVPLKRRVAHAVELIQKGHAQFLLLTGGTGKYPPSEAVMMKRLAESYGISASHIILDETAASTMQNAAACARIMKKNRWSKATIVTDGFHLKRSLLAFRHFGISAIGSSPVDRDDNRAGWRWWYQRGKEVLALVWYLIRIKFGRLT
ncbi:MAG: YdcF family protein [Deltaproteobacteria bacterium]|nr:MAG: YdcF family protein [Deltaproteobacteria bacterium]